MAKGRRLTNSRSERYLGAYPTHAYSNGAAEASEFREEDVWSMVDAGVGGGGGGYYGDGEVEGYWAPVSRRDNDRQVGGLTMAFEDSGARTTSSPRIVHQLRAGERFVVDAPPQRQRHVASSAPVNVPDWSKILRVDSVESMHDSDDGEFEDDRDSVVAPPHEYLARSRKTSTTSVFEGVGRTLKGRDLSRLRDAVWSQTGFDG